MRRVYKGWRQGDYIPRGKYAGMSIAQVFPILGLISIDMGPAEGELESVCLVLSFSEFNIEVIAPMISPIREAIGR